MNVTFAQETLTEAFIDEVDPMTKENLKETGNFAGSTEDQIAWDLYRMMQQNDCIRVFSARNGSLVGYALFGIYSDAHLNGLKSATQDVVYISPKARSGMLGLRFLKWCDEQLKKDGVKAVYQYASLKRNIGPILKRMGYEHIQDLYVRRLG